MRTSQLVLENFDVLWHSILSDTEKVSLDRSCAFVGYLFLDTAITSAVREPSLDGDSIVAAH
jgi:hypothetical protein